jgi:hypothetical protein
VFASGSIRRMADDKCGATQTDSLDVATAPASSPSSIAAVMKAPQFVADSEACGIAEPVAADGEAPDGLQATVARSTGARERRARRFTPCSHRGLSHLAAAVPRADFLTPAIRTVGPGGRPCRSVALRSTRRQPGQSTGWYEVMA